MLAEFASVKARPTQSRGLAVAGGQARQNHGENPGPPRQHGLGCEIGITLASIVFAASVGEPAFAELILPVVRWVGIGGFAANLTAHGIAIAIAYLLVSFLHIVSGELFPRLIASPERAALFTAYPMIVFPMVSLPPNPARTAQ